jgi:hypothetical protein
MDTSSETASVHPTLHPQTPAITALGGALTDFEWDALLARYPEGSAERADALELLLGTLATERLITLPIVDRVQILWRLEDASEEQQWLTALIERDACLDFNDWVEVVMRVPEYQSAPKDAYTLRFTLEKMHAFGRRADWVGLTERLTFEWPFSSQHVSAFYRDAVCSCGRTATRLPDLLVAFRLAPNDLGERIAIYERMLALSPDFETTERELEPLCTRDYPPTAPGEYEALSSRCFTRLNAQAQTLAHFKHLAGRTSGWQDPAQRATVLRFLAERAESFEELTNALTLIGNDKRFVDAASIAASKLARCTRPFADWWAITRWLIQNSQILYALALRAALTTATRLGEYLELLPCAVSPNSPIHPAHRRLLQQILAEPLRTAQYRQLLELERDEPRLRRRVLRTMAAQPLDLERAYLLVVLAPPSSPSHDAGCAFLNEASQPFTQWERLLDIRIEDRLYPSAERRQPPYVIRMEDADYPTRCRFVLGKLTALAQTENEWRRVLEIATKAGITDVRANAREQLALLLRQTLTAAPATA